MPDIGLFFLVNVFPALLPPLNPQDRDYYEVLSVARSATNEDIRKAYKKKSLQLHPDKVAQRGNQNKEEAAAEYEKVQQAYQVLVNEEKRDRYHALNYSPTRYQFFQRGAFSNPTALYENLAHASFVDKTRLVVLVGVFLGIFWIQPVLVATKINHTLEDRGALEDAKWTLILIPYWILHASYICFWCLMTLVVPPSTRPSIFINVVEHILWFITVVLLANAWDDGPLERSASFRALLTPAYLAMILRWMQASMFLQKIRSDIDRMVTIDHLEAHILEGSSFEDIEPEERERILQEYILVTVPDYFEPILDENESEEDQEKEAETQRIESSPEYEAAIDIHNVTFGGMVSSVIFGIPFMILLVRKLDGRMGANWWIVFIPLWIYLGSKLIFSMNQCCCGAFSSDEIVIPMGGAGIPDNTDGDGDGDGDDDDDENPDQGDDTNNNADDKNGENKGGDKNVTEEEKETATESDGKKKSKKKKRKSKKIDKNPRQDSDSFAPPDSGMEEFQAKNRDIETGNVESLPEEATNVKKSKSKGDKKKKAKSVETDNANNDNDNSDGNNDDEAGNSDENNEGDDPGIRIDEDTFSAFQSAYAEAEQDAMQKQASAGFSCCIVAVQLLILCLVVAKLEAAYESTNPDDVGFNTFWIIFPFLLVFGLICCSCACLIYGASPMDMEEEHGAAQGQESGDDVESPGGNDAESPTILAPPPSAFQSPTDNDDDDAKKAASSPSSTKKKSKKHAQSNTESTDAKAAPEPATEQSNMDDLD